MFCTFLMQCVKVEQLAQFQQRDKRLDLCTVKTRQLHTNWGLAWSLSRRKKKDSHFVLYITNEALSLQRKSFPSSLKLLISSWESSVWLREPKKSNSNGNHSQTWHKTKRVQRFSQDLDKMIKTSYQRRLTSSTKCTSFSISLLSSPCFFFSIIWE